jgi:predicted GH43/DUF377 family glycosyl hydrolase
MKWQKHGLVYVPSADLWWAKSHAYLPTVETIENKYIRVYFAGLDDQKFGRIGYVDLDIDDPTRVLFFTKEPILDLGKLGTFDDSGVSPSCMVKVNGKSYLYYVGWQRTQRTPYMSFAGLAISDDNGNTFQKYSRVPILDRTMSEPFIRSATTIIEDKGIFRMWYVSAFDWINFDDQIYPSYVIRHTHSVDGIHWDNQSELCIDFNSADEFGFGRPWVIKDESMYKMWYSIRSKTEPYRLGYAESRDGITWERKDEEVGITRSETGWDSEMICFSCVLDVAGKRYMFYNGNRHGATGFGCAELIEE